MNLDNKTINESDSNCEYDENQNIKAMPNNENTSLNFKAQLLQKELNDVNCKVNDFLSELCTQVNSKSNGREHAGHNRHEKNTSENFSLASMNLNMTTKMYFHKQNNDELPERVFTKRNSLLTEMFKINHIRTIRNIFTSIMIMLALHVVLDELVNEGKISMNFDLIFWCFGNFQKVLYTWIYMKLCTSILVYYCFHYWSKYRLIYIVKNIKLDEKSTKKLNINLFDSVWAIGFCLYLTAFLILPASVVIKNKLPPASAAVVLLEQIRMLMKSYAFVRSNIPRALRNGQLRLNLSLTSKLQPNSDEVSSSETEKSALNYKKLILTSEQADSDDDENEVKVKSHPDELNEKKLCPDFSNYLYFLFAPTFIYRDSYPRNSKIKWHYVFNQLIQIVGAIIYVYYIFMKFCIPVFKHFNTEHVTVKMFVLSILSCHLPGTLLLLLIFYGLLHCWLNAFAEMLKFADRMFYKDWWNSTNYSNYYRTWNVVVHDWLYTYIYKDLYYILGKKNRLICQLAIFLISAAFHEYVITLAFGFFYPVLFLMFGAIGFGCMYIKSDKNSNFWNFFTWVFLQIGLGVLMCLYSIEFYARLNCSQSIESNFLDYILPRSFTCGTKLSTPISVSTIKFDL